MTSTLTSFRWIGRLSAILLIIAQCTAAFAQPFPSKPVRIIVPFPAGGPADAIARAIAQQITPVLGQQVIVENRPGANTMIAAEAVAKSMPDGHTLLYATDATLSINPLIYTKISYKQSDFTPITALCLAPEYLLVSADVPVNNLREFIAYAKANPGKLNYGSFGIGSNGHLAGEAFNAAAGTKLVHVPYKGMVEVINSMLSGDVQVTFTSAALAQQHMKTGKIKALAVTSSTRTKSLPDVPTYKEAGLAGFESLVWFGLFAPAKTPAAVVQRLGTEVGKVTASPEFADKYLTPFTLEAAPVGPDFLTRSLITDQEKYTRYVKYANVKLD